MNLTRRTRRFALGRPFGRTALIAALCAFGAARLDARITIQPEFGFNQTYKAGGWAPLRVTLENYPDPEKPQEKPKDFNGQLRIEMRSMDGLPTLYSQPLELPAQARKRAEFSVVPPASMTTIKIELIDSKGGLVAAQGHDIGSRGINDPFDPNQRREAGVRPTVLLVGDANDNVSLPGGAARSMNTVRIAPEALPEDYLGYDAVSTIVIRQRLSTRLSEDQLAALKTWLELGGKLIVVTPRANAEIKIDPWLAPLLPGKIAGAEDAAASDLTPGDLTEMILFTRWEEIAPDAKILWETPLGPAALERPAGAGRVIALSVDPSAMGQAALKSPLGLRAQELTAGILFTPEPEDLRARHFWSTSDIDPAFQKLLLLPNIWVVTALLLLFVIVVGPLNFFLLKRRRRLELAWATIPGLSILFFVLVYTYGVFAKGGDQYVATTDILHLKAGESKGLLIWNAIHFSPHRRAYQFALPGGGGMLPLMRYYDNPVGYAGNPYNLAQFTRGAAGVAADPGQPATLVSGAEGRRLSAPLSQWKMSFFQGERPQAIEGAVRGKVVLLADGAARVEIFNDTAAMLADAELSLGQRRLALGDLAPGAKIDQPWPRNKMSAEGYADLPTFTKDDDDFHRSASAAIRDGAMGVYPIIGEQAPQRRCRLLARQIEWTSALQIDPPPDYAKTCAFLEIELPVEIEGTAELVSRETLGFRVSDFSPNNTRFFDNQQDFCTMTDGWVELIYSPPALAAPVRFVEGTLRLNSTSSTNAMRVSFFNSSSGEWVVQMPPTTPAPQQWEAPIPPECVNPNGGHFRVRIEGVPAAQAAGSQPLIRNQYPYQGVAIHDIDAAMTFAGAQP